MDTPQMLCRIRAVEALPASRLRITYEGGEQRVVDFGPVIRRGGVFAAIAKPHFLVQAAVDPRGRAVCWPGEIEFCADALWLEGHAAEVA
jgi:hypothetical protein